MMQENAFLKSLSGKTLGVYFNAYRSKAYDGGGEENQEGVLLHHLGPQVADVVDSLLVLGVSLGCQLSDGVVSVRDFPVNSLTERLVLGVPGGGLGVGSGVESSDISLAGVVLRLGKVLQVGDVSLAGVVLPLSEVLQVLDLLLARIILRLGPAIQALDLCDPGLVVLLSP